MFTAEEIKKNINHYIENSKFPTKASGFNLNKILNSLADLSGGGGGGYTSVEVVLTEAEVRTLKSANGGYGYEMLPAPGVGKVYQVINPILIFDELTGSDWQGGVTSIYPNDSGNVYTLSKPGRVSVSPEIGAYQLSLVANVKADPNNAIWLYNSAESPAYLGTATFSFDYKIIDITV
jgi:hypothetical protein